MRVRNKNRNRKQEENKMNEVLYVIELLLSSLTWVHAVVIGLVLVGVIVLFRLFKAKQDKIEEYLEDK